MFLIDDLVMLPIRGVLAVTELIYDEVAKELNDPEAVRRQLVELRLQYEMGEVDDVAYVARETALVARLREIRLARLAEHGE